MVTIAKNANHSQKLFPATVFTNDTDDKLKIKLHILHRFPLVSFAAHQRDASILNMRVIDVVRN